MRKPELTVLPGARRRAVGGCEDVTPEVILPMGGRVGGPEKLGKAKKAGE